MANSIGIADVIAWVESKGDGMAYRFEPLQYAKTQVPGNSAMTQIVSQIQKIHNCSLQSARVIYSSSFGRYQIMGFNLYGQLKVTDCFGLFLNGDSLQLQAFNTFLAQKQLSQYSIYDLACSKVKRELFGKIYNGDGPGYGALIAQALQHFGYQVQ